MIEYSLEQLKIGMEVHYEELGNIKDVYIVLTDLEGYIPNLKGKIQYITKERDKVMTSMVTSGKSRCIYNSSDGDWVDYDG